MSKRAAADETQRLVDMFKALSNPNRLRIYSLMTRACDPSACNLDDRDMRRCVGNLGRGVGIAPSTVSHHIKELRQAGLIRVERRGKIILCSVDQGAVSVLAGFFARRARSERGHRTGAHRKER